jgi:hypothetical protein
MGFWVTTYLTASLATSNWRRVRASTPCRKTGNRP